MKEEFEKNVKNGKKKIKKMKKNTKRLILSIALFFIGGFVVPGAWIADSLVALLGSDFSILVAILVKAVLMVGGAFGTIISLAEDDEETKELEQTIENNQELFDAIENELDKEKEKNLNLKEELNKIKEKDDNSKVAEINNKIARDTDYSLETNHKVKRK